MSNKNDLHNKLKNELKLSIKNGSNALLWIKIQKKNKKLSKKTAIIRKSFKQRRDIYPYVDIPSNILKKMSFYNQVASFAKIIYLIKSSRYKSIYLTFPKKLNMFYQFNLCAVLSSRVGASLKF